MRKKKSTVCLTVSQVGMAWIPLKDVSIYRFLPVLGQKAHSGDGFRCHVSVSSAKHWSYIGSHFILVTGI